MITASRITDSERAEGREEPTVLPHRTEHRTGERAELGLEAVGRVGDLHANRPVERLRLPLIEGGEEVMLVVEVLVHERSSDLRTLGNRPHRDRPGPTLGEEVTGDVEQQLAALVRGQGHRHPSSMPGAVAFCHPA